MNDIVFGNYKVHFYVVGLCRYFVEQLQFIADSNFCGGGLGQQFVVISFSSSQSIQLFVERYSGYDYPVYRTGIGFTGVTRLPNTESPLFKEPRIVGADDDCRRSLWVGTVAFFCSIWITLNRYRPRQARRDKAVCARLFRNRVAFLLLSIYFVIKLLAVPRR